MSRTFVLLHRHGHRSPSSNVFAVESAAALQEVQMWSHLLVNEVEHDEMSKKHPIHSPYHDLHKRTDVASFPFGCLTSKGKMHMTKLGAALAKRHSSLKGVRSESHTVSVSATNFQRTQASVQALLLGMGARTEVPVVCRHVDDCGMAFFDKGDGVKTRNLIKTVQATPEFVALEAGSDISGARQLLMSELPSLTKGPSGGFNYFAAFDYFYCRLEHSLPVLPSLQGERVAAIIEQHMASRFRLYFTHPEHIAQFVLPLLQDIKQALQTKNLLTVFSGHDVNILGLLHGLGLSDRFPESYWPSFGSTVLLEVDHSKDEIVLWHDLSEQALASFSMGDLDEIMEKHRINIK